jgi:hypothetical protein
MGFKGDKIRSTPSFGGKVKPACKKETYEHAKMLVGKIRRPCFSPVFHLLRYYMSKVASLLDVSDG